MNTNKKWGLGAFLAVIGAFFAGWLTAPQSGKETREDIKDAALKAKSEAEDQLHAVSEELKDLSKKGADKASELKESAKVELEKLVSEAKIAQDKAKTVLSAVRGGETEDPELKKALKQAKSAKDNLVRFWENR